MVMLRIALWLRLVPFHFSGFLLSPFEFYAEACAPLLQELMLRYLTLKLVFGVLALYVVFLQPPFRLGFYHLVLVFQVLVVRFF